MKIASMILGILSALLGFLMGFIFRFFSTNIDFQIAFEEVMLELQAEVGAVDFDIVSFLQAWGMFNYVLAFVALIGVLLLVLKQPVIGGILMIITALIFVIASVVPTVPLLIAGILAIVSRKKGTIEDNGSGSGQGDPV
jgi:hypothetical protein